MWKQKTSTFWKSKIYILKYFIWLNKIVIYTCSLIKLMRSYFYFIVELFNKWFKKAKIIFIWWSMLSRLTLMISLSFTFRWRDYLPMIYHHIWRDHRMIIEWSSNNTRHCSIYVVIPWDHTSIYMCVFSVRSFFFLLFFPYTILWINISANKVTYEILESLE
jgi:hypothetical protein